METEKKAATAKRNKPKFLRNDWHKKIRLGRTVKKNRKWKGAKGRQNKLRLNRKGHSRRPKVGWSSEASIRGKVSGLDIVRVENVKELMKVEKGMGILVASVGKKKRLEIIAKATEMKFEIINKYLEKPEEAKK